MCVNGFRGSNDFFFGGIELSVADIVTDCSGEQEIVLRHNPHLLPEAFNRYLPDIVSIDPDLTALNVIKTADQIDNRCFTGTGRTNQGNRFTGFNIKAHVIQNLHIILIGKVHMGKGYPAFDRRKRKRFRCITDGTFRIHNFKDTFGGSQIGNDLGVKVAQIHNRVPEHTDVGAKGHQRTDRYRLDSQNFDSNIVHGGKAESPA